MADRRVSVTVDANLSPFNRALTAGSAKAKAFASELESADSRMANLVQTGLALGPALVPMGATAVPVITSLTTQLGFAAAAAGVAVAAFNGTGDALDALNAYQLEPTAENLAKLEQAMADLPASAREFVRFLDGEVLPALEELQAVSADGVIPGAQSYIEGLMTRLPQVRDLVDEIATTTGELLAEGGADIASGRWDDFLAFLTREARPNLEAFATTVGNVAEGVTDALMGLDPVTDMVTDGIVDLSQAFADMDPSDYAGFADYVQKVGPQVADTLLATGEALLAVVEAAAPVGSVALPVIEVLAKALEAVASSPAGPVLIGAAAGLSAMSRAVALYNAANGSALLGLLRGARQDGGKAAAALGAVESRLSKYGALAGGVGVLALSLTELDDSLGISNAAMGTALGLMAGPWGAAVGGAAGALLDLKAANDKVNASLEATEDVIRSGTYAEMRDEIAKIKEELADFESGRFVGRAPGESFLEDLQSELAIVGNAFTGWVHDRESQLDRLRMAMRSADIGTLFARDLGIAEEAFDAAAQSAKEFGEEVNEAFALLDKRAALRAARDAVRDFAAILEEAPANLRRGTQAYDDVQAALDNIADSSLTVAKHLRGMDRANYLDRARVDFLDAARKLGLTQRAAQRLADRLGLLDKQRAKPEIDVETSGATRKTRQVIDLVELFGNRKERARLDADNSPAARAIRRADDWLEGWGRSSGSARVDADNRPGLAAIMRGEASLNDWDRSTGTAQARADGSQATGVLGMIQRQLSALDGRNVTSYATVVRRTVNRAADAVTPDFFSADGMTVPKSGLGYADRWLAMLADGEEVISNRYGQADRFRADRAAGRIPAYADGGTVRGYADGGLVAPGWWSPGWRGVSRAESEFGRALSELTDLSRRELRQRRDLLADEVAHHKERRQHWRDERQAFADAVASAWSFDPMGSSGDMGSRLREAGLPEHVVQRHLATARAGALTAGLEERRDVLDLLKTLESKGLDGPAFRQLAASGDVDMLRSYASMSRRELDVFEDRSRQMVRLTTRIGRYAGGAEYGAEVRAQTKELRESRAELKAIKQEVAHLRREVKQGAKAAGDSFGRTLNGSAAEAGRRGR